MGINLGTIDGFYKEAFTETLFPWEKRSSPSQIDAQLTIFSEELFRTEERVENARFSHSRTQVETDFYKRLSLIFKEIIKNLIEERGHQVMRKNVLRLKNEMAASRHREEERKHVIFDNICDFSKEFIDETLELLSNFSLIEE
jgi:hypothetical protein